jgi:outer membrane protein assembly factor BamD
MDYKASLIAFDNFIADYPGTPLKEDALFYKYDSAFNLAINSVPSKMEERLNSAKLAYSNLIKFKSETKHKEKANQMLVQIDKKIQNFTK